MPASVLPGHPHLDRPVMQIPFEIADAVVAVVHHRRHQGGIRGAGRQHVIEMFRPAGATAGDDRNTHGLRDACGQSEFVAVPRAVGIDGVDHQLAGKVQNVLPADVPVELTNLRDVRSLPWVLAAFLGLLAIAAVSHVLVSSSHRRSRDLAVLRAIGFTRRSSRLAVNAQATVIAIVGLAVGVPAGIVLGRIGWRLLAERVPLQDVGPIPALALVLVVPLALVLLNAIALWPAQTVARLRPAELLRDE